MKTMEYKGFTGSLNWAKGDRLYYGRVLGIKSLVGYEGETLELVEEDFHDSLDMYLDYCTREGLDPRV